MKRYFVWRYAFIPTLLANFALIAAAGDVHALQITVAGRPGQLDIRAAGDNSVRLTLKPVDFEDDFPFTPTLAERAYLTPVISLREISDEVEQFVGRLHVAVRPDPLAVRVTTAGGELVQEVTFHEDGTMSFKPGDQPVLGMGEGGPQPEPDSNWRARPIEFDRRGRFHEMQPRWQSDAYGSRNPVALLIGTEGWGLFVATPWGQIDLEKEDRGLFIPIKPADPDSMRQSQKNQQLNLGKGIPPMESVIPGLYDLFIFDAHDPAQFMKDLSVVTGPAVLPPKWALGYLQSHRTLEDDAQLLDIVDTFRAKEIPVDAVIYLGTGFTPRGWNTEQPSFDFNPEVFKRDPRAVISDLHDRHVKVALHMVPWDRDRLPTLHGSIPPQPGETIDESHIQQYWQQHVGLVHDGIDAWWPDEGDWFDLFERIKRHQLYYQGPLSTRPNIRPWSLHRNGHLGVAQWGGWIWSGDTRSTWKTLEAQIAVGINHSLSLSPFWGSDIGGFYPSEEFTGELYARWFQFGAFTAAFRSHGRTWWMRLPWGWGLSELGPLESQTPPDESELNNSSIEPIAKKYAELRYQLLPYTYTLAWEARNTGMPLMRAMWLHYPDDEVARDLGSQYLWGRDLLVAPVFTQGATSREVYLPSGEWYDWWTNERETGRQTITRQVDLSIMPIYVRAGAIIPFDPVRQYTSQVVDEPTTLRIYQGADGEFTLYEDDGISLDYLDGEAVWTHLTWDNGAKKLTIQPHVPDGATNLAQTRTFSVELLPEGTKKEVVYSGQRVEVAF